MYHDGSGGLSTVHQNGNAAKDVPSGKRSPQTLIIPFIKIDLQRAIFDNIHFFKGCLILPAQNKPLFIPLPCHVHAQVPQFFLR